MVWSPEARCSMLVPIDVHCFEAGEQDMQQRKSETATTGLQPPLKVTNAHSAQLPTPTMPPEPKTKGKEKDNVVSRPL